MARREHGRLSRHAFQSARASFDFRMMTGDSHCADEWLIWCDGAEASGIVSAQRLRDAFAGSGGDSPEGAVAATWENTEVQTRDPRTGGRVLRNFHRFPLAPLQLGNRELGNHGDRGD